MFEPNHIIVRVVTQSVSEKIARDARGPISQPRNGQLARRDADIALRQAVDVRLRSPLDMPDVALLWQIIGPFPQSVDVVIRSAVDIFDGVELNDIIIVLHKFITCIYTRHIQSGNHL